MSFYSERLGGVLLTGVILITVAIAAQAAPVNIGLNYPKTGPYSAMGKAQLQAAKLATSEINEAGGIKGREINLITRDTKSKPSLAKQNVTELIDDHGAKMVFGGSSSAVAIASGKVARSKQVPYFGTLTYSNATTGKEGHRFMMRECYNAYMGAKVLGDYMKKNLSGKKFFYITADYTWGWSTEDSIRKFSNTTDESKHPGTTTPFPGATPLDFKKALTLANANNPDVIVLVLFGSDMTNCMAQLTSMGLKGKVDEVIVPNLTLGMAKGGGPQVMAGAIGALPWSWNIPFEKGYERGKKFVNNFAEEYEGYPSTSAASAYSILYEYERGVEKAGTFEGKEVIKALEGTEYKLLKGKQRWRKFDHQNIQSVFAVRCKPRKEVLKDKFNQDYFEIIKEMSGEKAARTRSQWNKVREEAGKPTQLKW